MRFAVRLHFQEVPRDLHAAIGYTLVISMLLLLLGNGYLLAILFALFVPGYVLVAAVFPGNAEIDWIERIALSFGLSIAVVPLLGVILSLTPWGIRFVPIVASTTLFTFGAGYVAHWRRMRLTTELRLCATLEFAMPNWEEGSALDKVLTIALVTSLVVAAATLAYVVVTPPRGSTFTEFYVLGPGGNASGYPTRLNASQPAEVVLGIASHEAASVNYAVHVDLVGVKIVYNGTEHFNETVEVNRTRLSIINLTLEEGRIWTLLYRFSIAEVGLWKLQFLLYKGNDSFSAYRELNMYVQVAR